jgi:hypothetical protein
MKTFTTDAAASSAEGFVAGRGADAVYRTPALK